MANSSLNEWRIKACASILWLLSFLLVLNDGVQGMRQFYQLEARGEPASIFDAAGKGDGSKRPVTEMWSALLPNGTHKGEYLTRITSPISFQFISPDHPGEAWAVCVRIQLVVHTTTPKDLTILTPGPGEAMPASQAKHCGQVYADEEYGEMQDRGIISDGLHRYTVPLIPNDNLRDEIQTCTEFAWRPTMESQEGNGRRFVEVSYDSSIYEMMKELDLTRVEPLIAPSKPLIPSRSANESDEASGVQVVITPNVEHGERLTQLFGEGGSMTPTGSSTNSSEHTPRLDVGAEIENPNIRREVELRNQREQILIGLAFTLLLTLAVRALVNAFRFPGASAVSFRIFHRPVRRRYILVTAWGATLILSLWSIHTLDLPTPIDDFISVLTQT